MSKNYWLLKSEPHVFSFIDLWNAPGRRTPWDGVRNYTARNRMRDEMRLGDGVLFYHSSCPQTGIAGVCEVASAAYPDPTQVDPSSKYFDPKSSSQAPRWQLVDVRARMPFARLVSLAQLRADPALAGLELLKKGNRLSVQVVGKREWEHILALGGVGQAKPHPRVRKKP